MSEPAPSFPDAYDAFADEVVRSGIILDPWQGGEPRLDREPLVLSAKEHRAIGRVAEDIAELYEELCQLVDEDDELLDTFFALGPAHKLMWNVSRPLWHGFARADVFETAEGFVISELNCDTPTGEPEATVLGALAQARRPDLVDPNRELEGRFTGMVDLLIDRLADGSGPRSVGLVYPTEFTEDLSVVRLYRRWLTARGFEVVLGSPYNLGIDVDKRATLFGRPVSAILRHYKTDAWGERDGSFVGDDVPDAAPLALPLSHAIVASAEQKTAVINPFGAILPQNKRSMAMMWELIHRFSQRARSIIENHVPYTSRLETIHKERLLADREGWVMKSAWGAEGEEVIIGRDTTDTEWRAAIESAREGRWIAQRFFRALGKGGGDPLNYGVFLMGGEASGLYVRREAGATDDRAISMPVLVDATA